MVDNQSTLRILLCSDIHEDWANIDKVLAQEQAGSFDYVFVPGDQAAINNKPDCPDTEKNNLTADQSNRRVIQSLTSMHKPEGKLFWIPGNHDCQDSFDADGYR